MLFFLVDKQPVRGKSCAGKEELPNPLAIRSADYSGSRCARQRLATVFFAGLTVSTVISLPRRPQVPL
jgi:hypothetical protein